MEFIIITIIGSAAVYYFIYSYRWYVTKDFRKQQGYKPKASWYSRHFGGKRQVTTKIILSKNTLTFLQGLTGKGEIKLQKYLGTLIEQQVTIILKKDSVIQQLKYRENPQKSKQERSKRHHQKQSHDEYDEHDENYY